MPSHSCVKRYSTRVQHGNPVVSLTEKYVWHSRTGPFFESSLGGMQDLHFADIIGVAKILQMKSSTSKDPPRPPKVNTKGEESPKWRSR